MNLVLIGSTGSGKTTLARVLSRDMDVPYIGSGEIARELAASDDATKLALQQGAFAPERAMRAAVQMKIEAADVQHGGWILDGFPRTTEQMICLLSWTAVLPTFVYLDVTPWICIERLVARGRPDDNPDSIARKLRSFDDLTVPMLTILGDGGTLHHLDGNGRSIEQLAEAVREIAT